MEHSVAGLTLGTHTVAETLLERMGECAEEGVQNVHRCGRLMLLALGCWLVEEQLICQQSPEVWEHSPLL